MNTWQSAIDNERCLWLWGSNANVNYGKIYSVRDVPPRRALQFRVYSCVNSGPFFLRPLAFFKFPLLAIMYPLGTFWLVWLTIFCDLLPSLAHHSFHSSSHLIDIFLLTDFSLLTSFIMLIYFLPWFCHGKWFCYVFCACHWSCQLLSCHLSYWLTSIFVSLVFS